MDHPNPCVDDVGTSPGPLERLASDHSGPCWPLMHLALTTSGPFQGHVAKANVGDHMGTCFDVGANVRPPRPVLE
eukprot:6060154-Lingulodinium_polyedra.AAC.2